MHTPRGQARDHGLKRGKESRGEMRRLTIAVGLGLVIAVVLPTGSHAAEVSPTEVGAALGGSWERQMAGRSPLVKRSGLIPARCSPGRFTSANRGRLVDYYGSQVGKFARGADTEVLTYSSASAAKRGLRGLKRWVTQCPGPVFTCKDCGAGPSELQPHPRVQRRR